MGQGRRIIAHFPLAPVIAPKLCTIGLLRSQEVSINYSLISNQVVDLAAKYGTGRIVSEGPPASCRTSSPQTPKFQYDSVLMRASKGKLAANCFKPWIAGRRCSRSLNLPPSVSPASSPTPPTPSIVPPTLP